MTNTVLLIEHKSITLTSGSAASVL